MCCCVFPFVPRSVRTLSLVVSMLLRVCWWLRRWCPLMVDCIPAWLSASLEMHQEMLHYTVRGHLSLCLKLRNWKKISIFCYILMVFNSLFVSVHLSFSLSSFDLPVWLLAQPGLPHYLSVSPGPASVFFSLKALPISGGTPITSFVLQWRETAAEQWKELTVPASGKASAPQSDSAFILDSAIINSYASAALCLLCRSFRHHHPQAVHTVRSSSSCLECSGSGTVLKHKQCSHSEFTWVLHTLTTQHIYVCVGQSLHMLWECAYLYCLYKWFTVIAVQTTVRVRVGILECWHVFGCYVS